MICDRLLTNSVKVINMNVMECNRKKRKGESQKENIII
jgi:hypothetical protein